MWTYRFPWAPGSVKSHHAFSHQGKCRCHVRPTSRSTFALSGHFITGGLLAVHRYRSMSVSFWVFDRLIDFKFNPFYFFGRYAYFDVVVSGRGRKPMHFEIKSVWGGRANARGAGLQVAASVVLNHIRLFEVFPFIYASGSYSNLYANVDCANLGSCEFLQCDKFLSVQAFQIQLIIFHLMVAIW